MWGGGGGGGAAIKKKWGGRRAVVDLFYGVILAMVNIFAREEPETRREE